MTVPTMGLNEGDPRQLGGYRLLGRLRDSSLGVVYLGRDGSGDPVSVAVLDSGAVGDGGARERFAEVVRTSPDVVAARTHGRSALWAAVAGEGPARAEELLAAAAGSGRVGARGPVVMPHWAGSRGAAAMRWAPWGGRRDSAVSAGESNWWLIAGLGLVLVLLLLLVSLLYWWMLQFPQPEMPGSVPPQESQESPEGEPGPGPGSSEEEGEGSPSTPVLPTPGEGDGQWDELPEDNL